jgi:high-affinity nickel-transport protein
MIGSLFAVFALGLRHGADPDHIAAIDNLTRNSFEKRPFFSRFVGTLFAAGHTVMVLAIAALVGYFGTRFAPHHELIETIGTWISILVLILIAALNLRQLRGGGAGRMAGVKTRLMPRPLREGTSPWLALPVGFLFGFGFETSSQIATYTLAFGANGGVAGAVLVGAMFCFGMILTDTLDSVLVHRLVSDRSGLLPSTTRVWIWSVTIVALAIAGYELVTQILGWKSPIPDIVVGGRTIDHDLVVSGIIVVALLAVFAYVFVKTRRTQDIPPATQPGTLS